MIALSLTEVAQVTGGSVVAPPGVDPAAVVVDGPVVTDSRGSSSPSNRTNAPPPTVPLRSSRTAAATAGCVTIVSASTKNRMSPVAAIAPALRVAAIWRWLTETTRALC